jgi:ABC-2 type transport system permease protein
MVGWKGFFYAQAGADGVPIKGSFENLPAIMKSLGILLGYIAVFLGSAIYFFKRKDILS